MQKRRSKGVVIFVILFLIGALLNMPRSLEKDISAYQILFKGLSQGMLIVLFWLNRFLSIAGFFVAVGLFLLKDTARKIAIAFIVIDLGQFLLLPFANFKFFAEESAYNLSPRLPEAQLSMAILAILGIIYAGLLINFIFDVSFIYFFTRANVKSQFLGKKADTYKGISQE